MLGAACYADDQVTQKIIFYGSGGISTTNLDGSGLTSIIPSPGPTSGLSAPALSPDGAKIAYSVYPVGNSYPFPMGHIFTMNSDGSGAVDLTPGSSSEDFNPVWSPDGTKIAFTRYINYSPDDPANGVYVMNSDGSNAYEIAANAKLATWSPDGSRIAYDARGRIGISNADGSNQIMPTPDMTCNGFYGYPAWSPDGTKIAMMANCGSGYLIATMKPDGTGATRVLSTSRAVSPSWTPDSSQILYSTGSSSANNLYFVNATGGTPRFIFSVGSGINNPTIGNFRLAPPPNNAPTLTLAGSSSINQGDTYSSTSSFADADSSSWTATVDYGDGSGVQSLSLSGMSFDLSHQYNVVGTYAVSVSLTDNQGATALGTLSVAVNNVAPSVGPITAPTTPVRINTTLSASASFTDPGAIDTHTASWDWGDGTSSAGTVVESAGAGSANGGHIYSEPGVYEVALTVTDNNSGQGVSVFQYAVIYDATTTRTVSGTKEFTSPLGALVADTSITGKASFGFTARYDASGSVLPIGNNWASLTLKDGNTTYIDFNADAYTSLVVSGTKVTLQGTGTYNGVSGYTILITAIDNSLTGGQDLVRYQIKSPSGAVVYDTQGGNALTANPVTPVSKGKITVK